MGLSQHLGGSLEKVTCKTHLERTLTRVEVLNIFWQQFNIFIKIILHEENTSIYKKKIKTNANLNPSLYDKLLKNSPYQAMNGGDPLHW